MATKTALAIAGDILPGYNLQTINKAAAEIVPLAVFATLQGWDKLDANEQNLVATEGQGLARAMLQHGYTQLAIGEHLTKVQAVLEPHSMFGRFLKPFHFSKRTAYRYIRKFENASKHLPVSIVQAAMTRGIPIAGESETAPLGTYTAAAAKLPPPANADIVQANTWLDQVEVVRKQERSESIAAGSLNLGVPEDPQTAAKIVYRTALLQFNKLPNNARVRSKWVRDVIGLLMTGLNVSNPAELKPVIVPADFTAQRGRPRAQATA